MFAANCLQSAAAGAMICITFRMQQTCAKRETAMATETKIPASNSTSNNLAVRRCMVRRDARPEHR